MVTLRQTACTQMKQVEVWRCENPVFYMWLKPDAIYNTQTYMLLFRVLNMTVGTSIDWSGSGTSTPFAPLYCTTVSKCHKNAAFENC